MLYECQVSPSSMLLLQTLRFATLVHRANVIRRKNNKSRVEEDYNSADLFLLSADVISLSRRFNTSLSDDMELASCNELLSLRIFLP